MIWPTWNNITPFLCKSKLSCLCIRTAVACLPRMTRVLIPFILQSWKSGEGIVVQGAEFQKTSALPLHSSIDLLEEWEEAYLLNTSHFGSNYDMVCLYLQRRASTDALTADGKTPLDLSTATGNSRITELLSWGGDAFLESLCFTQIRD